MFSFARTTSPKDRNEHSLLSDHEMKMLQRNSVNFQRFLDCNDYVIAGMFEKMIITERKREELLNKATYERNDVVFSLLLKASYGQVCKFKEILEANQQHHVAELVRF